MGDRTRAVLGLAWAAAIMAAGCAAPASIGREGIRDRATSERADPPREPPERPAFLRVPRTADPALANRTLAEVEAALAPLREAAEPAEDGPEPPVVAQARSTARRGELGEAAELLLAHVRKSPQDTSVWRELGRVLDAAGRRDLAADAWSLVLRAHPTDAEALSAGGMDAAAMRRPLQAAERLLQLRQLRRVGEAPSPEPGQAIAEEVALGLSLRELGHLRAAAECLEASAASPSASAAVRRQSGDLGRMAGECWQALGEWDRAAEGCRAALQAAGPEDRVALPRLVWTLLMAGRRWAALAAIAEALPSDASGHAGLPEAVGRIRAAWPDAEVDLLLGASEDAVVRRAAAMALVARSSPTDTAPVAVSDASAAISSIVQAAGPGPAAIEAVRWVAADPAAAERVAVAMRGTAVPAARWRQALAAAGADAALLLARFDLSGGDPELAWDAVLSVPDWRDRPPLVAAALAAAAAMEDRRRLLEALPSASADVAVTAAAAEAFAAIGESAEALRWAERSIEIAPRDPRAWLARAAADQARGQEDPAAAEGAWRGQAAISAERAWECAPQSRAAARKMLELASSDPDVQTELAELATRGEDRDVARREWDRHQSLRRVQQGQGEPVLETLRALLTEDPSDVAVAAALVAAAASAGDLPEAETWLEGLHLRRPAAPAVLEALVSARARQGRLLEGVQALREASEADPASPARRRAWARGLAVSGRQQEAWTAIAPGCGGRSGPRATLECAEQALRADREKLAVEMLLELCASPDLTAPQRRAVMAIANRVPGSEPRRRELLAKAGSAALSLPDAGAPLLAAAMLTGTEDDARAMATVAMREWKSAAILEAAQWLLEEKEPRRAEAILLAAIPRQDREGRRAIERALSAALCARGQGELAESRLRAWRKAEVGPLLVDRLDASLAEDLNELGGSLLIAGHKGEAERLFARAVEDDGGLGSALNNLAWLRIERGEFDARTDDLVRRALESAPEDPSTLDTAAWRDYLRCSDAEATGRVVDMLRRATAGQAPSLESLDHLGDALWSDGLRDEAADVWRRVVEAGGGRASRERVMQAFDQMQRRLWGLRAWDAASFYDARDGAALGRAKAKLKALAEGLQPPVTPRPVPPPADPAPPTDDAP